MRLWNLQDQKLTPIVLEEQRLPLPLHNIVVSADNHWLVTRKADNTARVWDLTAVDPSVNPHILRGHEGSITSVAFSPDDHWLVTGSADKTARLWGLNAREPVGSPIVLQSEHDNLFVVSNDNHWLVTIGGEGSFGRTDTTARVWDLTARDPASKPIVLTGHEGPIFAVAFSPDNHWLVTGSSDQTARLWNLAATYPLTNPIILRGHDSVVAAVAFSPDQRWLVTGSFDGTARLWRMTPTGAELKPAFILSDSEKTVRSQSQSIFNLHISPDSQLLVTSGSAETPIRLWDLAATNPAANSVVLTGAYHLAISPDSHWLVATGRTDKTARLWDLRSRQFRELPGGGYPVAFSPDHHWLVTCNADARLWDLTSADPAATSITLPGSKDKSIEGVVFSPDNHWLVTGNEDNTARLWNLKDLTVPPLILKGHTKAVDRLAISADSRWLATGSYYEESVRLWDLTSNNPSDTSVVLSIDGSTGQLIAFSNDSKGSRWLVTGNSAANTVLLWNLRLSELEDLACRTAGRNLSEEEWKTYFPGQKYRSTCSALPVGR
jgi:WD40 repeat protein